MNSRPKKPEKAKTVRISKMDKAFEAYVATRVKDPNDRAEVLSVRLVSRTPFNEGYRAGMRDGKEKKNG